MLDGKIILSFLRWTYNFDIKFQKLEENFKRMIKVLIDAGRIIDKKM